MEEQGIIETVNQNKFGKNKMIEEASWISEMTIWRKNKNEFRICLDMREANMTVVREQHPLPMFEEIVAHKQGYVIFSKLDIKKAFRKMELHENSRYVAIFNAGPGKRIMRCRDWCLLCQ